MELRIKEVRFFINALQSIENVNYECKLLLSQTGIRIMGMGPSRISLFDFKMGEIGDETPLCSFGIELADFGKILDRIKSTDELILDFDINRNELKIKAKIGDRRKTFILHERDVDVSKIPLDSLMGLPYQTVIQLPTAEIIDALKDCLIYSDMVTIGIKDKKLRFYTYSGIGEVFITKEISSNLDFETSYGADLVLSKIDNMKNYNVDVVIGDDLPLYLNYELPSGYLRIFIAPRVE